MTCDLRPDRAIEAIARRQHSVISYEQMLEAGLSRWGISRRVRDGLWAPVLPRVYRSPTVTPTIKQGAMAACLWAGPAAMVSHRAAGMLWELDGVTATHMEITVPTQSRVRNRKLVVHRTGALIPADRGEVEGIAVTSPLRTLIDLAACLDEQALECALECAFRRSLTTPNQLRWRLGALAGSGRTGCEMLRTVLERGTAITGSDWEVRAARLLVRAGLPEPVRQYVVRDHGRFVAKPDLAYPDKRIAIEFDSLPWHVGRRASTTTRRVALASLRSAGASCR